MCCNIMIRNSMYQNRQFKALDVIAEKGKGPTVGKLRIIQLIEADLKLIIRGHTGQKSRNKKRQMSS